MKSQSFGINDLARRLSLPGIIVLIVLLNVYWVITLEAFGTQFEQVANAPLLDLQNVERILSPQEATDLITSYSPEARTLYWVFFILDNLMPPIVFGSISLLWAYALQRFPAKWVNQLSTSPLLMVPFGVGFFDCLENLCFVLAMSSEPQTALSTMQIGMVFVQVKVVFLFLTFALTPLLIITAAINQTRSFMDKRRQINLGVQS